MWFSVEWCSGGLGGDNTFPAEPRRVDGPRSTCGGGSASRQVVVVESRRWKAVVQEKWLARFFGHNGGEGCVCAPPTPVSLSQNSLRTHP